MAGILFLTLIYLIPLVAIIFFIVSICNYVAAKKKYKAEPNDLNAQKKSAAKTVLIVSSIIMGVLLVVVIGFIALMYTAVAYM